jgi:hypothetical protein
VVAPVAAVGVDGVGAEDFAGGEVDDGDNGGLIGDGEDAAECVGGEMPPFPGWCDSPRHQGSAVVRSLLRLSDRGVEIHLLQVCWPGRRTSQSAPQAGRQVLTVVATRERLMGFEEPSESGVVGGPPAHQGYLQ